jgi:hypothetical protein
LTLVAHQRATFSFSSQLSVSSTYCCILYWFLIPVFFVLCLRSRLGSTNTAIRISIMHKQAKTRGEIIFTDKKRNRWNSIGADKSRKFHIWMCFRLLTTQLCIVKNNQCQLDCFPLFRYVSVPPQKIRIIEDNRQVSSVIGPYDEGDQLSLNCIVTGGNPVGSLIGCFQ